MRFTKAIGHFCIKSARIHVHRPPEYFACATCGQGESDQYKFHVTKEKAALHGVDLRDPRCPGCGDALQESGPQHFGELHIDLCIDERVHYGQWHAEGKVADADFEAFKATLSQRELLGFFDHKIHHMAIRLESHEVDHYERDPAAFFAAFAPKIRARLEVDAQFSIQHRYRHTEHSVTHLVRGIDQRG